MKKLKFLLVAAVGVAPFAIAGPAQAACVGTQQTLVLCAGVDPNGEGEIRDCVYVGGDQCQEVVVPLPGISIGCGGALLPPAIACSGE